LITEILRGDFQQTDKETWFSGYVVKVSYVGSRQVFGVLEMEMCGCGITNNQSFSPFSF